MMDVTNTTEARARDVDRLKNSWAAVATVWVGLLLVGCSTTPTTDLGARGGGNGQAPVSASNSTEDVLEVGDDSGLYLPEPVTVGVMGGPLSELDNVVPIEELAETAESLGQDIVQQLVDEGAMSEVATFEAQPAEGSAQTTGFGVSRPSRVVPAATSAYTRLMIWNDNKYVQNVLRQGTSTWGWAHSRDKHKVTQTMIKKTTQFPRTRTVSGSRITYVTPAIKYVCWLAFCSIEKQMDVRVVYDTRRQSDSFAKGVITTYCEGLTICPQWVRDVAG